MPSTAGFSIADITIRAYEYDKEKFIDKILELMEAREGEDRQ